MSEEPNYDQEYLNDCYGVSKFDNLEFLILFIEGKLTVNNEGDFIFKDGYNVIEIDEEDMLLDIADEKTENDEKQKEAERRKLNGTDVAVGTKIIKHKKKEPTTEDIDKIDDNFIEDTNIITTARNIRLYKRVKFEKKQAFDLIAQHLLRLACRDGHINVVKFLLHYYPKMFEDAEILNDCLMLAYNSDRFVTLRLILTREGKIIKEPYKCTVYMLARSRDNKQEVMDIFEPDVKKIVLKRKQEIIDKKLNENKNLSSNSDAK